MSRNLSDYKLWGHVSFQVCKLLRHVAPTETLQIASKYSEINLRLYGPQLLAAAHIVCLHPNSKIAKENFEGECRGKLAMIIDNFFYNNPLRSMY